MFTCVQSNRIFYRDPAKGLFFIFLHSVERDYLRGGYQVMDKKNSKTKNECTVKSVFLGEKDAKSIYKEYVIKNLLAQGKLGQV